MSPALRLFLADTETRGPEEPAWALYAEEVLAHAGVPHETREHLTDGERAPVVVLLAGDRVTSSDLAVLLDQVAQGTVLIACGGVPGLALALGMTVGPARPSGQVCFGEDPRTVSHFGGVALGTTAGHEVLATYSDGAAAVVASPWGDGQIELWGVDVWQSVVRIQQGWPIEHPSEPAPDGSVPKRDAILRVDDSLALAYDRRTLPPGSEARDHYEHVYPPTGPSPIFARPEADLWRARLMKSLMDAHRAAGAAYAWLDYWPNGLPAVAHLSHDSDRNIDSQARAALGAFAEAGVTATWCHCHPGGYSAEVIAEIGAAGHEQAFHYNAVEDTEHDRWGFEHASFQLTWARAMTGAAVTTNKNHYTRWEGWTEFYDWCDRLGIAVDQSRGPSKQGTVGFPFGSAHLWRPLLPSPGRSRMAQVLELPLHTQDLVFFAHESVRDPILDGVLEVHGVAHFLFHGSNMEDHPGVVPAVARTVEAARARGFEWWTAEHIGAWERARRAVRMSVNERRVEVTTPEALEGLGVLLPVRDGVRVRVTDPSGRLLPVTTVERHGAPHWLVRCDLPDGMTVLEIQEESRP